MPIVNIRQAKRSLSGLIKRGSKPVARLVAIAIAEAKKERTPGSMKGKLEIAPEFFDPLPEDELAAWEGYNGDPLEDEKK